MYAVIFIMCGFVSMEFSGWLIHKHIMHGPLWKIHKTHHQASKSIFELNDLFSLFFGTVAVLLIFLGLPEFDYRFWMGVGITIYGIAYFLLHDVMIHKRLKWLSKPKNRILAAIFRAHQAHHYTNKKEGSVSFGLFVVPKKYYK